MILASKLSTNATTAIVIVAGLAYLGYLAWVDPKSAAVQVIPVLGAVAGMVKLLHQGNVVEQKADIAADKADAAAGQADIAAANSRKNSIALTQVSADVAQNTVVTQQAVDEAVQAKDISTGTHEIVNSRFDEFRRAVTEMPEVKAELSAARAEIAAIKELARGITIGRGQAAETLANAAEQKDTP